MTGIIAIVILNKVLDYGVGVLVTARYARPRSDVPGEWFPEATKASCLSPLYLWIPVSFLVQAPYAHIIWDVLPEPDTYMISVSLFNIRTSMRTLY